MTGRAKEGKPAPAEGALGASEAGAAARPRRWSARRKQEAVLRLLRGEDLESLSRELGVPASRLASWRDTFLAGGLASLKSRGRAEEARIARLERKLGETLMELELVREKAEKLEALAPDFPWRRSRR